MFDWDQDNIAHIARHDITPQEAEQVLRNYPADGGSQNFDSAPTQASAGTATGFGGGLASLLGPSGCE